MWQWTRSTGLKHFTQTLDMPLTGSSPAYSRQLAGSHCSLRCLDGQGMAQGTLGAESVCMEVLCWARTGREPGCPAQLRRPHPDMAPVLRPAGPGLSPGHVLGSQRPGHVQPSGGFADWGSPSLRKVPLVPPPLGPSSHSDGEGSTVTAGVRAKPQLLLERAGRAGGGRGCERQR